MREFIAVDGEDWWAFSESTHEILRLAKEQAARSGNEVIIYKAFRVARPVTKVDVDEFKPAQQAE